MQLLIFCTWVLCPCKPQGAPTFSKLLLLNLPVLLLQFCRQVSFFFILIESSQYIITYSLKDSISSLIPSKTLFLSLSWSLEMYIDALIAWNLTYFFRWMLVFFPAASSTSRVAGCVTVKSILSAAGVLFWQSLTIADSWTYNMVWEFVKWPCKWHIEEGFYVCLSQWRQTLLCPPLWWSSFAPGRVEEVVRPRQIDDTCSWQRQTDTQRKAALVWDQSCGWS